MYFTTNAAAFTGQCSTPSDSYSHQYSIHDFIIMTVES